jgi:hypothetical protein
MSGLSTQAILNKLAAEGTTAATQSLIIDFLNAAPGASAIAGIEHQDGPVEDDPTEGFGDQVADYDIGAVVAQRILARRNALGSFTSLTQLNGIRGFGADKLNDLLFSFSGSVYEISGIVFNYNNASISNDALNLRKNATTAASSRSWKKGQASTFAESTALYAIQETQGNPLAVRVAFRANGISGAFIRAIGGGRLGPAKEHYVSFDAAGFSGYETFELSSPTFHAHGVNAYGITWQWQWRRKPADPWRSLVTTRHRIYAVLRAPTLPWVQTVGSASLPWTDALDIACNWASGATNQVTAASRITSSYNASGRVSYDTVSGATFYGFASYNLTQMINRLNGGVGLGAKVNCTDSADTVSTFANLIGCDLWQSRMGSNFDLNPIIAIGYNVWAIPFNGGFSYHEVAWTNACTETDRVFDGCLKVDADADPTAAPHTALLPVDMVFGDCATMNYRLRLCPPTPTGCAKCQPQPMTTRKRRPII